MKLRNKVTGEIVDGESVIFSRFDSLAKINEAYEDYNENKGFWYIDCDGSIFKCHIDNLNNADLSDFISINNKFKTLEEAEQALEKLKAWKRLKDRGIKFNLDFVKNNINFTYKIDSNLYSTIEEERIIFSDLKLIFGDK